jgi:hypothetical protein
MISTFYNISLDFYNYLFLFFNYELLVVLCFFFFLLFALISEKGQLGTYLYDVSLEQRIKLTRYLNQRNIMTRELIMFLEKSIFEIKKIATSYDHSSDDFLLNLQYLTKKLLLSFTFSQIKTYLDIITLRSQYLAFQIKLYLSTDLFINKTFKFKRSQSAKMNTTQR